MSTELTESTELTIKPPTGEELVITMPSPEYSNDFPLIDGRVVWYQQEWENDSAYKLFRVYLDQGADRSVFDVARNEKLTVAEVLKCYNENHWYRRVEVYQDYKIKVRDRLNESRSMEVIDLQYSMSMELLSKSLNYCNTHMEEFKPTQVIKLIELTSKLARSSVGLFNSDSAGAAVGQLMGSPIVNVNTQNTLNADGSPMVNGNTHQHQQQNPDGSTIIDVDVSKEDETTRVAGILNVLHTIGALNPQEAIVEQLNPEDVILR